MSANKIFLMVALICFMIAAFRDWPSVNWIALGLAGMTASFLL